MVLGLRFQNHQFNQMFAQKKRIISTLKVINIDKTFIYKRATKQLICFRKDG